jgi:hypothetical protein
VSTGSSAVRFAKPSGRRNQEGSASADLVLPPKGRDLRLDLFRGLANWQVFINHIPNNILNWITTENYGFSDAADLFVFISGFTASFVYARTMLERGTLIAGTRILGRAWQIYVAQVLLFCLYDAGYRIFGSKISRS